MKKQKTRRERELGKVKKNLFWVGILVGMLIMLGTLIGFSIERNKIQDQLSECQEQVPVRESVLFIKCDDGTLLNLLVDKDNRTLYDYYIPENCEVLE